MNISGKKILVTRALEQNQKLISMLEAKQAIPIIFPCIEIQFLDFEIPKKDYDCIIFTSLNSKKALSKHLIPQKQISINSKNPDSASIAEFFKNQVPQNILLPQGDLADSFLENSLKQSGHEVTKIIVYRTQKPKNPISHHVLDSIDAITFTSPSTVHYFFELGGHVCSTPVACIGNTTYKTAYSYGFPNLFYANPPNLSGMIQALEQYKLNHRIL